MDSLPRLMHQRYSLPFSGGSATLERYSRRNDGDVLVIFSDPLADSSMTEMHGELDCPIRWLTDQGMDVFHIGALSRSAPALTEDNEQWALQHILGDSYPHQLHKISQLRPGAGQVWLGEGNGSLLLLAFYARCQGLESPLCGFIHVDADRALFAHAKSGFTRLFDSVRRWRQTRSKPDSILSRALRLSLPSWSATLPWLDPIDGRDISIALQTKGLPPSFYLTQNNSLKQQEGHRQWLKRLGEHDAMWLRGVEKKRSIFRRSPVFEGVELPMEDLSAWMRRLPGISL